MDEVPDGDLRALALDAERMVRAAEAYRAEVLGEIDRRGLFAGSGHRDVAEYARGVHRMAPRESRDTKRLARLLRAHPEVGERMSLGMLGVAQARLLACEARRLCQRAVSSAEGWGFTDAHSFKRRNHSLSIS